MRKSLVIHQRQKIKKLIPSSILHCKIILQTQSFKLRRFTFVLIAKTRMMRQPYQQVYEVEEIMGEATMQNEYDNIQMHYLIKWKNLGHQFDTWEPISSLKSIQNYLTHWILEKRMKDSKKKLPEKRQNFKAIKKYLPSESFTSKRRIRNEKYADQILKKKKVWQSYLPKEEKKCIILDVDQQELMQNNKELFNEVLYEGNCRNRGAGHQDSNIFEQQQDNQPKEDNRMDVQEDIPQEPLDNNEIGQKQYIVTQAEVNPPQVRCEEPLRVYKPTKQKKIKRHQKQCQFKVVGQIDMRKIVKIHRNFTVGGAKILEISMKDGKKHFVREDDVKKINPSKLLEYYQDQQIDF